ncbi:MAG: hypothetical protein KF851_08275 [Pirellulaceae bacterium]|nr:hypothetical protein [Pirellulaceae bacterium]
MTTDKGIMDKDAAIEKAMRYAESNGLGQNLEVQEVFYRKAINDEQKRQMEEQMGRQLDAGELRLFQEHNKSGWVVQLVFEQCENGATPQGPKVLVDDTGEVSHFRPM